jgi:5-formyltetrahydrofolate cyclo-ligase
VAPEIAARAAASVAAHLSALPALERARRVALYASLPDELPSRPIYDALAAGGASLVFPRAVEGAAPSFAAVSAWSELRPGRYGVLEPPAEAEAVVPAEGDLVLVPGVAFDRAGHRLGRGGGFYDRAFPAGAARAPLLIGVAYAFQLVELVPHGALDRRVDAVVTERGLAWTGSVR